MNVNLSLCPVCLADFDNNEVIPKVLGCGHSLCSKCISKILLSASGAFCPTCRASIGKKKSFPKNYSLLDYLSKYEKVLATQEDVETASADFKMDVTKLLSEVKEEMASSCTRMKFLATTLSRVVELEQFEENNISVKKALREFSEIRKDFTRDAVQPDSFETLNIADFEDERNYLYEVYRSSKTGSVFAIHSVGKEYKYGEVTVIGNKIFVHCLSSLPENLRNTIYVWFQELKRCWMNLEFGAFLQIPCITEGLEALVEIELTEGHGMLNQYLKLCTGEIGPSHKGAPYVKHSNPPNAINIPDILFVSQYISDGNLKTGQIDYCGTRVVGTKVEEGEIIAWIGDDLRFGFGEVVNEQTYNNIIGKVVSPYNFADIICFSSDFPKKIGDCGVYFNLK